MLADKKHARAFKQLAHRDIPPLVALKGEDGQLVTGKAPKSNNDVFRSQQELIQAQSDPRYENDEAYQEAVLQKLARSNVNF